MKLNNVNTCILIFAFSVFNITGLVCNANNNYNAGAGGIGLSGATVCLSDHWSAFYNQAGLAELESLHFGVYSERKFNISELSTVAIAIALPVKDIGAFAFSFYNFSFEDYFIQQKAGFAYSKKLSPVFYTAVQLNLFRTAFMGIDDIWLVAGESGLIVKINESFSLGTHIFNPSVKRFFPNEDERLPVIMRIGGLYKYSDKLYVAFELENEFNFSPLFKLGINYSLNNDFSVLTGISAFPVSNSFGIELNYGFIRLNIAFLIHQILGVTPHISMDYIGDSKD